MIKNFLTLLLITVSSIVYSQADNQLTWETKLNTAINKSVAENATI